MTSATLHSGARRPAPARLAAALALLGALTFSSVAFAQGGLPPDGFSFTGEITSVEPNAGSFHIHEFLVRTNANTAYANALTGEALTFGDLAVGLFVEATGTPDQPNNPAGVVTSMTASGVTVLGENPPPPPPLDITFEGRVDHVDPMTASFFAAGFRVQTTAATTYLEFPEMVAAGFDALAVGQVVEVTGQLDGPVFVMDGGANGGGDGTLPPFGQVTASSVRFRHQGGPQPFIVHGRVTDLGITTALPPFVAVNHQGFRIGPETEVFGPEGMSLGLGALEIGQLVELHAIPPTEPNNFPLARRIQILNDEPPPPLTFEGRITELQPAAGLFIIDHMVFVQTNNATEYLDFPTDVVGFDNLALNQLVRVQGLPTPGDPTTDPNTGVSTNDGGFFPFPLVLAAQVRFLGHGGPEPFPIRGHITELQIDSAAGALSFVAIDQQVVRVSPNTQVFGPNGGHLDLGALALGQFVEARAVLQEAGGNAVPFALEIHILNNGGPQETLLRGVIQTVDSATQTLTLLAPISGAPDPNAPQPIVWQVWTSASTQYSDADGNALTFNDLMAPQFVEARGESLPTAGAVPTLQAHSIVVLAPGPPPTPPFTFEGAVTALHPNAQAFEVDHHFFVQTGPNTQYLDFPTDALGFANLAHGQLVQVTARSGQPGDPTTSDPNGGDGTSLPPFQQVFAETVRFLGQNPPQPLVLEGAIASIADDGSSLQLSALSIFMTDATVLLSDNTLYFDAQTGVALTLADFAAGDAVRVEGFPVGSGSTGDPGDPMGWPFEALQAISVARLGDNGGEHPVDFEASVLQVGENSLVVSALAMFTGDITVLVTPATHLQHQNGEPLTLAEIAAGDLVRVHGLAAESDAAVFPPMLGPVTAFHIALLDGNNGGTITVFGQITALNLMEGSLDVWGQRFLTNADTQIVNAEGSVLTLDSLNLGDFVVLTAAHLPGTVPVALHIQVQRDNTPPNEVTLEGLIQDIIAETNTLFVAGHFIETNDNTQYFGLMDEPLSFADLSEGQFVLIVGEPLFGPADGNGVLPPFAPAILAHEVRVREHGGPMETVVFGAISSIEGDGNIWTVRDVAFVVTDNTAYSNEEGLPLEQGDFAVGSQVLAELSLPAGPAAGANVPAVLPEALSVTLFGDPTPPGSEFVHLVGLVEALDAAARVMTVGGQTVRVLDDTLLLSQGFNLIDFEDFAAGDAVRVLGFRADDGTDAINARVVRRLPVLPPPQELGQLTGHIAAVDAENSLIVVDMTPRSHRRRNPHRRPPWRALGL